MDKHGVTSIEWVPKKVFDEHFKNNDFIEQPATDAFGDGYGDPYNPWRQAYGTLKNGKSIYCERHSDYDNPDKQK